MLGERTGKRYRLGDRVRVKVVRVDMESTKIDFMLESTEGGAAEAKSVTGKIAGAGAWGGDTTLKKTRKANKHHG